VRSGFTFITCDQKGQVWQGGSLSSLAMKLRDLAEDLWRKGLIFFM